VISFGPFKLVAGERLLTRDGIIVPLGARALDILIELTSRQNESINKKDLMDRVWPDVTVTEGSLRFHIASLRQALGDGEDGARYISTQTGRGYCFVAPISRSIGQIARPPEALVPVTFSFANVPSRLMRMVGRADGILMLSTQLADERFVTIVGSGGVGKTTVAVAVGHELIDAFSGAVLFVDLGALTDPNQVAASIGSMLGLSVEADDPTPGLIEYLRDKRFLLIFDNCEHLMEAAAALTERIFVAAPQVHILATSREALRVEGEHVHRLAPLAVPPDCAEITAAEAMTFPAIQLFVERVTASGVRLNLSDSDAAIVAGICRKLDGVPLAIELAAGRVRAHGLRQTAELLEERLSLLWQGQRTAPHRQQTLKAMLDWSYGLLTELEREVLRKLAVFVGYFTLDAARVVLTSEKLNKNLIVGAIDSLVDKSMVATFGVGTAMRYRLLDTTRAYALDRSIDDSDRTALAARHADYYRRWLEQTGSKWPTLSDAAERALRQADLANVRAALEWCFGDGGATDIGIGLAAAASRFLWATSLLAESHRWAERAILALDEATRGTGEEMHLQAALGMSLMFAHGETESARAAFNRSLAIADARGDAHHQLQLLVPMSAFHTRIREFGNAQNYAKIGVAIAEAIDDEAAVAVARTLLGIALHFIGDLSGARAELEAALQTEPGERLPSSVNLGSGHHIWGGIALARTLWMQGQPARAVQTARQAIKDAAALDTSLTLALNWAIPVFLWTGDLHSAEQHVDWYFARCAQTNSEGPVIAIGRGFRGQLAICRGDAKGGIEYLQGTLGEFQPGHYELATELNISLVEGLAAVGRHAEAIQLANENIRRVEAGGDMCYMPELLRVKGNLLLSLPQPSRENAEECFKESLALSRRQGASAWELRTAIDLAGLSASTGRRAEARALLQRLLGRFEDGSETSDIKEAERLLSTLN